MRTIIIILSLCACLHAGEIEDQIKAKAAEREAKTAAAEARANAADQAAQAEGQARAAAGAAQAAASRQAAHDRAEAAKPCFAPTAKMPEKIKGVRVAGPVEFYNRVQENGVWYAMFGTLKTVGRYFAIPDNAGRFAYCQPGHPIGVPAENPFIILEKRGGMFPTYYCEPWPKKE